MQERRSVRFIGTLLLLGAMTGCASQSSFNQLPDTVVLAEPERAEFRYEIELARIAQMLREDLTEEQRGELYYRRGALYDAVGLRTLARMDFTRALEYNPRLADAYNFLGIQYTQLEEFDYAYEAFDSAIELNPEHRYAYLNRGIAEYYDARTKLSQEDLEYHLEKEPDDPYRVIWLFLAEHENDAELAQESLAQNAEKLDKSDWGYQIVQLYTGKLSEEEFLQRMTRNLGESEKLTERLCEAYFYLGKYMQMKGEQLQAVNYFKLALMTNVYGFVEHRYASVELTRIRESLLSR
ncbi:lipoprotein NlpI [Idiomarina sp. PL1-037]|jgi:Lipoprotein NlpI, contains TPR repeats|uniref:lipoprotein NlpI n=1 Tax=unclassified Idiomarina TaxID=2614829 RepID=UPI00294A9D46|nr:MULTISPECIES: lipoprotein NlpI [unclassified Idiomarina]MDV6326541.1 lipoprotein NlpI [Idiomarina sp. Sol25]WQC53928.1 lipoprotein NlpI [Idiomarina sp. PL1-037]